MLVLVFLGLFLSHGLCQTTGFPGIIPTSPDTRIYTITDSVTQPQFIPGMTTIPPPPADVTTSTTTTTTNSVTQPSFIPEMTATPPPPADVTTSTTTTTTNSVTQPSFIPEMRATPPPPADVTTSTTTTTTTTTPGVKPPSNVGKEGKTTNSGISKPPSSVGEKSKAKCLEYSKYAIKKVYDSLIEDFIDQSMCQESETLIVGGNNAKPKEFPHQVALGAGRKEDIYWMGGGSLISERFVLSAEHINKIKYGIMALKWARIGDYDLSSTEDEAKLESMSVTIEIEKTIPHPNYQKDSFYDDILLIRLMEDVVFGEFIRPICLHTEYDIPKNYGIVTGWGDTDTEHARMSDILQKVNVSIHRREHCEKVWAIARTNMSHGFDDRKMICAGNIGKDACHRDSGGPLQFRLPKPYNCMYAQIGVVSYGRYCGVHPGGYTRVSEYVSWIEQIVWP